MKEGRASKGGQKLDGRIGCKAEGTHGAVDDRNREGRRQTGLAHEEKGGWGGRGCWIEEVVLQNNAGTSAETPSQPDSPTENPVGNQRQKKTN